jgi:hypothetical protein
MDARRRGRGRLCRSTQRRYAAKRRGDQRRGPRLLCKLLAQSAFGPAATTSGFTNSAN